VRPLAGECFNAFIAPISIWQVIGLVLTYLGDRRHIWRRQGFPQYGFAFNTNALAAWRSIALGWQLLSIYPLLDFSVNTTDPITAIRRYGWKNRVRAYGFAAMRIDYGTGRAKPDLSPTPVTGLRSFMVQV
jgi:hypothetical protein